MPDVWINLSAFTNLALLVSLQNKELQMSMEKMFTDFYLTGSFVAGSCTYGAKINSADQSLGRQ